MVVWWDSREFSKTKNKKHYGMSGRKEAAKKIIWRQEGKKNQVYTMLKEKSRKKNSVSWKVVMAKISFSN